MTAKLVVLSYQIPWFWFGLVDAYHVDVPCPPRSTLLRTSHGCSIERTRHWYPLEFAHPCLSWPFVWISPAWQLPVPHVPKRIMTQFLKTERPASGSLTVVIVVGTCYANSRSTFAPEVLRKEMKRRAAGGGRRPASHTPPTRRCALRK